MDQGPPLYVTADIVNIQQPLQLKVSDVSNVSNVSDVFEIPMDVGVINNNAMNYIMKQVARQTQNTAPPSVTTKMSDISLSLPVLPGLPSPVHGSGLLKTSEIINKAGLFIQGHNETTFHKRSSNPITTTTAPLRHNRAVASKVMIEDEDKDTAIDYDDDDPDIKKTKLSLFHFAKDITFNLIFTIPFLRTKLNSILKDPGLAINQIERVFDEFKDLLNRQNLESIKKYVCEDGIRDKLNFILESGFNKILADGKIDINDAPQFNQLVYFIIKSFNNINQGKVYRFYVSREHVMILLHFILKSVFTLTLKGEEEQMAIGLLDTSFKLVQLEVLPLISKRWYHKFRICHAVKEIEELIE
jgi:hypothetical protein